MANPNQARLNAEHNERNNKKGFYTIVHRSVIDACNGSAYSRPAIIEAGMKALNITIKLNDENNTCNTI